MLDYCKWFAYLGEIVFKALVEKSGIKLHAAPFYSKEYIAPEEGKCVAAIGQERI